MRKKVSCQHTHTLTFPCFLIGYTSHTTGLDDRMSSGNNTRWDAGPRQSNMLKIPDLQSEWSRHPSELTRSFNTPYMPGIKLNLGP